MQAPIHYGMRAGGPSPVVRSITFLLVTIVLLDIKIERLYLNLTKPIKWRRYYHLQSLLLHVRADVSPAPQMEGILALVKMGIPAHNSIYILYIAGPVFMLRLDRYKDISRLIRDAHVQRLMAGAAF